MPNAAEWDFCAGDCGLVPKKTLLLVGGVENTIEGSLMPKLLEVGELDMTGGRG